MAAKKTSYISLELEWMDRKIKEIQLAIDGYDLPNLVDTPASSKGDQLKTVVSVLEKLPGLLRSVDELRQTQDMKKSEIRGKQELNPFESGEI